MTTTLFVVTLVVVTALVFDFTNGFHDSANAMATSVATGALQPRVAVLVAAILNVIGAFLSTEVAKTISGGMVNDTFVTPVMIFAGLVGAILWNLTTWLFGLPSSSSHALFGGLIGAVLVGAGTAGVNFSVVVSKIVLPALIAPLVAGLAAGLATFGVYKWMRRADDEPAAGWFRRGQTVSGSMIALAHGTSDGKKTMGVITLVLITAGYQASGTGPQVWVIVTAGLAIGLGTYSGGWRIMRTMGKGIVEVRSRRVWPPRPPRRRPSSPPRTWASACPPPRCVPARSWAPGWAASSPTCAGERRGGWCTAGCSPCPPLRWPAGSPRPSQGPAPWGW
jgi:PiT family inorganic phosphate transporter